MGRRSAGSAMAAVSAVLASCLVMLVEASSSGAEGGRTSPLVRGALLQVPAQLAIFPLDTFKTRLQIPFGAPGAYQGSDRAFAVRRVNALQPPYWSGVGASLVNQLPTLLIAYNVFELARDKIERRFPKASKITVDVVASMIGSATGTLVSTPCEVVKCTFQSGMYTASVKSALRAIHKESGFRGFYQSLTHAAVYILCTFVYCLVAPQGCSAQLLRDLPLFAIMFASYEVLHDTYTYTFLARRDKFGKVVRSGGLGEPSDVAHAAMGAAAGALAGALTNPLDVVRTQATMRTWGGEAATSSLSLLPRIFAEQGVRGLMAGSMARSAYIGLGAAAFFVAYENSLKIMER